jgi:hypothetical protein
MTAINPDSADAELVKTCTPVPCPNAEEASIQIQPWVPTVEELRQAGAAIMQPDGSHYSLRNGEVVHVGPPEANGVPVP